MSPQQSVTAVACIEEQWHGAPPDAAGRLAVIVQTQRDIAARELDLAAVMELTVFRAAELTGAAGAAIAILQGDDIVYRSSTFKRAPAALRRPTREQSVLETCLRTGTTVRRDDNKGDADHSSDTIADFPSQIAVPLFQGGTPFAALWAFAPGIGAFSDDDVRALELIAGFVGLTLARSAEDTAKRQLAARQLEMEKAFRDSDERFRIAFDSSVIGKAILTPDGVFLQMNRAMCAIVGYTAEELQGVSVTSISHPDDMPTNLRLRRELVEGKLQSYQLEKRYIHKRGHIVWVSLSCALERGRDGRIYLIGEIVDISDRKRAERALAESERLARSTVDALGTHIAILDETGTILSVNRAWHDFAAQNDFSDGATIGANYLAVCDAAAGPGSEGASAAAAGIRAVIGDSRQEFYLEYPCHSPQEQRWFAMRVTRFGGDGPTRLVVAHENVTARKRAESLERERTGLKSAVAGMEHVLGVVGHELRTPLAGMRAMSEYLLTDDARRTAEWNVFIRNMHDEVVRMSDTVDNLLEAARLNSGQARWNWGEFALADVCDEALSPIRAMTDHSTVSLRCDVQPADALMLGDAGAIRRLLLNLVSNARKHTKQGSINVLARASEEANGRWIELSVCDTGEGIAPEVVSRLGEAFALNSGVVGANHVSGTGLGLAICKGVVAAHGGTMSVESRVGRGTRVIVRIRADLPAAVASAVKAARPSAHFFSSGEAR